MKFEELKTALSSYIKTEKLGPGDPLPSIVDLTRIFRLSGTTVRRAVRELTEEGVLNVIQGSGVYVAARRRGIRIVHVVTRTGKVPTGFQSSPKAIWPVLQAEAENKRTEREALVDTIKKYRDEMELLSPEARSLKAASTSEV